MKEITNKCNYTVVHIPDKNGQITTVINWLKITGVNKITVHKLNETIGTTK